MSPQPSGQPVVGRLLSFTADGMPVLTPTMVALAAALPLVLYLLNKIFFPTVDAREPPIIRPKIPFFGHIISLIREQTNMFDRLYKEKSLPIATLPMLNGQVYVINAPTLVAAAMRNRNLSFDPFSLEFAQSTLGMYPKHVEIFSQEGVMDRMNHVIHNSLSGENVFRMNVRALGDIATVLNNIEPGKPLDVPDVTIWLRTLVSLATMTALYGKNSPLGEGQIDDLMEFEKGVGLLAIGIAPNMLAPKALAARQRVQAALKNFYKQGLYEAEDVSAIIRNRAAFERDAGIPEEEIGIIEFVMPWVGTTNTIPTLCWFFLHVFSSPEFIARIREEVLPLTTITTDPETGIRTSATIDISQLEKCCPTLHGCYREALRLYSDMFGNRRVIADTTLRDTATGKEYLLRKGINVQWASVVTHFMPGVWGEDALEFRPERFVDTPSTEEKKRRGAMIPFGGGRNLCPGRNFALAENLAVVSSIALGFDVEGVSVPRAINAYVGTAMRRSEWDGRDPGARIARREGWETVQWSFKC